MDLPEKVNYSGLYESSPEDLRRELIRLLVSTRPLFTKREYLHSIKAVIEMNPSQATDFKLRITEQITFRQKNKVHNAATGKLF